MADKLALADANQSWNGSRAKNEQHRQNNNALNDGECSRREPR
jgi:hypothetical protein